VLYEIDLRARPRLLSDTSMQGAMINLLMIWTRRMAIGLILAPVLAQGAFASAFQAGMPRTQKHESRHEIDQLEDAWRNAVLKSNATAMDTLLADDYMAITPYGTLQTRDQALANLRSGQTHLISLNISDRKVRFYGTTALVTSVAEIEGTSGERDITGSYRYSHVYVRDARGKWKIVSFEANRIREADDHK
jgi:ketosteroid isomerase-like protein